jgi:hypothetical protein
MFEHLTFPCGIVRLVGWWGRGGLANMHNKFAVARLLVSEIMRFLVKLEVSVEGYMCEGR